MGTDGRTEDSVGTGGVATRGGGSAPARRQDEAGSVGPLDPGRPDPGPVLVTGAAGRLGSAVVTELVTAGYDVVGLDRRPAPLAGSPAVAPRPGSVRWIVADLGDLGEVVQAMAGCRSVVHLGAIPRPGGVPDTVVFATNTQATFSVVTAAGVVGAAPVVLASSLSALGSAWSPTPTTPAYAPVDEAHPLTPADAYGLSKLVDEATAAMAARRGLRVVALRFPWIATRDEIAAAVAELRRDPAPERRVRELWAYIELSDAARACRLALEARGEGLSVLNVGADDTLSEIPTEELLRRYAPGVRQVAPLPDHRAAFSCDRAAEAIGFRPRWSWRRSGASSPPDSPADPTHR